LPLDTITNARRFLRTIRPVMAFFIKYEFWYNYLHILKHRGVPVYSVSSIFREGQVFFKWYGRQYSRVLKCFTRFYVQNEKSKELLTGLGITNVTVTGDTRFDRVLQIKAQAKQLPVVTEFLEKRGESERPKVFVAGSSWPPDEEIFIRYFNEHPEWKLIIAPHVIGEDHLQQIESKLQGWHVERYNKLAAQGDSAPLAPWRGVGGEALIIDCFGLLSSIYRYGTVAYVGGGFGVGIHNLPEAAAWGIPVFFGPNNERFQEAQELKTCGGGIEINNYEDFERYMQQLESQPADMERRGQAAGDYVKSKAGATRKILDDVKL
jgi:3-deoxy-D-manno-octulosonic-acid transferase